MTSTDIKIILGVKIATGVMHTAIVRELFIYLDIFPRKNFTALDDSLAAFILENAKVTTPTGSYRMLPNYWIEEAHRRIYGIMTIFTIEEQKEILKVAIEQSNNTRKGG